jgi:hypothetical protein
MVLWGCRNHPLPPKSVGGDLATPRRNMNLIFFFFLVWPQGVAKVTPMVAEPPPRTMGVASATSNQPLGVASQSFARVVSHPLGGKWGGLIAPSFFKI